MYKKHKKVEEKSVKVEFVNFPGRATSKVENILNLRKRMTKC